MIVDCISDLHGYYPKLEGGDLLIVAGDLTANGEYYSYNEFCSWLDKQEYKEKIVIAGNHDNALVPAYSNIKYGYDLSEFGTYLFDSGTEFEGLKIWGSPWTKTFPRINPHCKAFTVDTEEELQEKWKSIPHDTDILVTHSPPFGILDGIPMKDASLFRSGSISLLEWLKYVERPKLHVFGHIHEGYGKIEKFPGYHNSMVKSVNASHVNERYNPTNKPIRVIL